MANEILTLNDLSVGFGVGKEIEKVTNKVSFTISKGQTLALVGESGSGKSVTANSILKLLPKGSSHYLEGSINFDGIDIRSDDVLLVDGHTLSLSAFCKSGERYLSGAMYSPWCDPCRRRLVSGAKRTAYICWSGRGNGLVDAKLGRGEVMALGCSCSLICGKASKRTCGQRYIRYAGLLKSDAIAMLSRSAMHSICNC